MFFAVAGHTFSVDHARAVLAAHGLGKDFLGAHRLDGVQDFGLLIAHRISTEGNGRFH